MLIIDSHLDLSWNALGWNRDLRLTAHETRVVEAPLAEQGHGRAMGTVSFPDLRRGQVGICVATFLARKNAKGNYNNLDFRTQEIACAVARGQLLTTGNWKKMVSAGLLRTWLDLRRVTGRGQRVARVSLSGLF